MVMAMGMVMAMVMVMVRVHHHTIAIKQYRVFGDKHYTAITIIIHALDMRCICDRHTVVWLCYEIGDGDGKHMRLDGVGTDRNDDGDGCPHHGVSVMGT